jgi:hypothetical protein
LTRRTVDRFGRCGALTAYFAFSAVKAAATSGGITSSASAGNNRAIPATCTSSAPD